MDYLNDFFKMVFTSRVELLIILCLNILGLLLKRNSLFPNKYIPWVILALSVITYMLIGNPGDIAPTVRHPSVVQAMWGFLFGVIAISTHDILIRRLEKYIPGFKLPEPAVEVKTTATQTQVTITQPAPPAPPPEDGGKTP